MKKFKNTEAKLNSLRSSLGTKKLIPRILINKLGINSRVKQNFILESKTNLLAIHLSKYKLGSKLKNQIEKNISFIKSTKTYKGIRHKASLPVRGQRTHTNAKTSKKGKFKKEKS